MERREYSRKGQVWSIVLLLLISTLAFGAEWKDIASWSGSGQKTTESFTVTKDEWRLQWKTTDEAFKGAGIFQVYVYDSAGTLVSSANQQGLGVDTSYVHKRGKFYLTINSANIKWTVAVQEER